MSNQRRYKQIKRVTIVGALVNVLLAIGKVVMGGLGHSHALVADGIHSFADLLTDALVLAAAKLGAREADNSHPYGHQRIETAASMFISLLLMAMGFAIAYDAFTHWFDKTSQLPSRWTLVVAAVSILANEGLFQYTQKASQRLSSNLLAANAWHHRSDALSSLVVLIGVLVTLLGFPSFDAIAALIVALMIAKMGGQLAWRSVSELVDSSVDDDTLRTIHRLIETTDGVVALHQLRTRYMADKILVDVHVLVNSYLSVSEGHQIAQAVDSSLRRELSAVDDVTVHIDPEDDEVARPCQHLPTREQLLPRLTECWQALEDFTYLERVIFHYLDGKIELVLLFSGDAQLPIADFAKCIEPFDVIRSVTVYRAGETQLLSTADREEKNG